MPRKKQETTTEPTVEKVEGQVEGKTSEKEELAIREAARERNLIPIDFTRMPTEARAATGTLMNAFRLARRTSGFRNYSSGAELQGAIDAFFELVYQAQMNHIEILPDIELLASFLGVTRNVLNQWLRGEANPEFAPVLDLAFNDIATGKKQYALQNKVAPLVYLSDMQNNHGYTAQQTKSDVQISFRAESLTEKQLIENANLLP